MKAPENQSHWMAIPMDGKKEEKGRLFSELEALQKDNRQLKSLLENTSDILFRMSLPDGRYEYVSPAAGTVLGYAPEQFYATPLLIKEIIHPDWHDFFKRHWELLLAGKMPPSYEYPVISRAGEVKWLYQKNVLICDNSGAPAAIEGTISDITERRKIEEALRTSEGRLLEAQQMARIGHWHWDVGTGDVEWSLEVYNIFRLDPERFTPQIDSILALSPWPEDNKRNEELIEKAVKSREQGSYEQKFLFPDGDVGYYFSTFQGVYNDNGDLVAIRGTVQDITEQKREQLEKARLEEKWRQAQKVESIGRLAGGVAHDLNNLLAPILGYGEMLMGDGKPELKRKEMASEIVKAGQRAKKLVGQLLAFSRKQTLEYKIVDLNGIVTGLEKLLFRTIKENITIESRLSTGPQTIQADIGQIEQVLVNLSVNAQDAMPDGGTIAIETSDVHLDHAFTQQHFGCEAGRYVLLAVRDTGCGMDENTRKNAFEPFFSTKGELGTGLGLATVYGIVKQHGGNILIDSSPGKGTSVNIYLPFFEGAAGKTSTSSEAFEKELRGSETILLVEDNEPVRRLTREILMEQGYRVLDAGNGDKALAMLAESEIKVNLLLTDVVMPGMDGKQLFTEAVKMQPGLDVLYMSGYPDSVIAQHGVLEAGVNFIQKPFSMQALAVKIRSVLDGDEEAGPRKK
jgi:PAS domain S-box-containing protein